MRQSPAPGCRIARQLRSVVPLLPAVLLCFAQASATPNAPHPGKWTPAHDFGIGQPAVHMLLVPDTSGSYHSRIVWWQSEGGDPAANGRLFGWDPNDLVCGQTVGSAITNLGAFSSAGFNIFCSGQIQIGKQVLVVGGTDGGVEIGVKNSAMLNPSSGNWTSTGDMEYRRWYPSSTALADGRVLVSGGSTYPHMMLFGGQPLGEARPDSLLRLFELTSYGGWDDPHGTTGDPVRPTWPDARSGHTYTSIDPGTRAQWMFGGQHVTVGGGGALDTTYLNDEWALSRDENETDPDFGYSFFPLLDDYTGSKPSGRADHVMIETRDAQTVLMGGRRSSEGATIALPDVWRFDKDSGGEYRWTERSTNGNGPGGRYDHVAFYDTVRHRMLVFGGRKTHGAFANDSVYALNLSDVSNPSATLTWSTPPTSGTRPSARASASMVFDQFARKDTSGCDGYFYGLMFGGVTAASDTTNELWQLSVSADAAINDTVYWRLVPASGDAPPGRVGHVAIFDVGVKLYGGTVEGTGDAKTWSCRVPVQAGDYVADQWQADWDHLEEATGPNLINSAAVNTGSASFTRVSEIWDPDTGWTELADPLLETYYPFHFLLPDGKVFSAGPRTNSYRLNLGTGMWQFWPADTTKQSGFGGGSAVQYRLGKILKCGTRNLDGTGTTKTIDLTLGGPSWVSRGDMVSRVNHNLVMLPNGEVLVTGGTAHWNSDTLGARRRPQLYSVTDSTWYMTTGGGDSLAAEPIARDYHSNALLLPDGRVLTGGGNNPTRDKFAIYCPPYLFRSDGNPRIRPQILMASHTAKPGDWINVCVAALNGPPSFCLMRPGSPTHGFDQNQRYVPLDAVSDTCEYRRYKVRIPASSDSVPPGYYMVFCLNDSGVPSVARWINVDPSFEGNPASCYGCGGGGGCPVAEVKTASGWAMDNTILSRSLAGELSNDAYRLHQRPLVENGTITLRLRENEREITTLDATRLMAVDHAPGLTVIGSDDGVVVGTKVPAWRVTWRGDEITDQVNGSLGSSGWWDSTGDTVLVEFDPPQAGFRSEAVQDEGGGVLGGDPKEQDLRYDPAAGGGAARLAPNRPSLATDAEWLRQTGVIVQKPDGEGGWNEIAHWYPREHNAESYFPGLGHGTSRLIFAGPHRLSFVGRLANGSAGATVETISPTTALHSRFGNVGAALAAGDSATILAPGDTLTLTFPVSEPAQGTERDYVLLTRGVYTTLVGQARLQPGLAGIPLQFALRQNRPNPFASATTIQFDLPIATQVRIDIFDVMGRRVRTITNTQWPAGYQKLEWDRRDQSGGLVHAGVYSYRMTAGSFTSTKKMVLLAR